VKSNQERLRQCEKILEERGGEYGPGGVEVQKVLRSFNAISGLSLEAHHFALWMFLIKWARHDTTKKEDNYLDAINYLVLAWEAENAND